jgi:hypothetical protein
MDDHSRRPGRRRGTSRGALVTVTISAISLVGACSDDDPADDVIEPSTVSTDSTTPGASTAGDPDEGRDNVDVDRDDSGAGSPSDPNSDTGSNSGAQPDSRAGG